MTSEEDIEAALRYLGQLNEHFEAETSGLVNRV
jgi:hypothetical protein